MKRFILLFCLVTTISSCNQEVEEPANLIPRTEMKNILKDIYIYRQVNNYGIEQELPETTQVNVAILDAHGVTLDEFQSSYSYYVIKGAAYDEILKEIKAELEAELP